MNLPCIAGFFSESVGELINISDTVTFRYGIARVRRGGVETFTSHARKMANRIVHLTEMLGIPIQFTSQAIYYEGLHEDVPDNAGHITPEAFIETTIGGRTFFLMAKNPVDGRSIDAVVQGEKPEISLITGPCLFGADAAVVRSNSGERFSLVNPEDTITEPITQLEITPEFSLYEIEALSRYTHILKSLIETTPHIKRIAFNVPEVEYYSYVLDAYQAGFLSQEQVLSWFAAVDMRHARLVQEMYARIAPSLHAVNNDAEVIDLKPLESIKEYFVTTIRNNEVPELSIACQMLCEPSSLWRDMLSVAPPSSWEDLNHLSYVYAELSTAEVRLKTKRRDAAIAVENPDEVRIFTLARSIVSLLPDRRFNLVGLYPHEQVVMPTGGDMYYKSIDRKFRVQAEEAIRRAYPQ